MTEKKSASPGRRPTGNSGEQLISMNALHLLIRVDRSTIEKWVKDFGCPTVTRPGDGGGNGWTFNVADVWNWHAEHVRQSAIIATMAQVGPVDGEILDWDERQKRAKTIKAELELGVYQGDLLFAEDVARKRDQEHGRFAQDLRSIPAKAAKEVNPKDQVRITKIIARYIEMALKRFAKGGVDDDDE